MAQCDFFWLDNQRNDTFGIKLQGPITFSQPMPRMETVTVPGRNGDLHYYDGSYNNVTGSARCFALEKEYVGRALSGVARYTLLEPGYHRLETSDEPGIYRMATVTAGPNTEIRMRILAPFELTFDCMPQKFLLEGEEKLEAENGIVLLNDWFPALPLIYITGSGEGVLNINDRHLSTLEGFSGGLYYDADTENAYYGSSNKNGVISAPEKMILPHGECEITWSGGIESVRITPRWWTL